LSGSGAGNERHDKRRGKRKRCAETRKLHSILPDPPFGERMFCFTAVFGVRAGKPNSASDALSVGYLRFSLILDE
jgi:hypothetical protein